MVDFSTGLFIWWIVLCTVSLVNVGLLIYFWKAHLSDTSNMFTVDILGYYSRWRLDLISAKVFTGFSDGLWNLTYNWNTAHQKQDCQGDLIWLVIYFSLAVWVSLAFTQAPVGSLGGDFSAHLVHRV